VEKHLFVVSKSGAMPKLENLAADVAGRDYSVRKLHFK
jgi:hypothetical protein